MPAKLRPPRQITVPRNTKIAVITHADTAKHFLDLAVALSETRKIISVDINVQRTIGTGNFGMYPNESVTQGAAITYLSYLQHVVIADGTQRLQYSLSVVNDSFDVYCFGYVVEA